MPPEYTSVQRLAWISSRRVPLIAELLFLVLMCGSLSTARAQQPQVLRYRFATGDRSNGVSSGIVWLYSYSWYGLQSTKLADIQNGAAEIPLDIEKIRSALNPHPNTDAYVVVFQFPQNVWFRSPDISPESIWKDLPQDLNEMGKTTMLPNGATLLTLPALVKRRITLLHEDGQPAAKVPVSLSIYLYDSNHCGHHTGLPLGNLVTDDAGTIEVTAPLVPLYLDNVTLYRKDETAPAGGIYELNMGLKLGSELAVVAREAWNFPDKADLPEQEFQIRVLDSAGMPLPDVDIDETLRANICGAVNGGVGQTDSLGAAHVRFVPQIVAKLELSRQDEKSRVLSADELRELFANKTLTIKW
jgi:hypothetical protein